MARLAESDHLAILDVLRQAGAVDEPRTVDERVLAALRRLVPCDVVAFHEHVDRRGPREIAWIGEPLGPVTPETREASRRLWHLDPLRARNGARKYSDYFTRRDWHRSELYQELARPLGVEYMMRLWIDAPGEGTAALEFDRATTDFDERDRAVLELLQPHLRQFRRRALRRPRPAEDERLTPREREVLEFVAAGRTNAEVAQLLWISPATVRKHLENAYAKLGVHTRTAAVAALREHA